MTRYTRICILCEGVILQAVTSLAISISGAPQYITHDAHRL